MFETHLNVRQIGFAESSFAVASVIGVLAATHSQ